MNTTMNDCGQFMTERYSKYLTYIQSQVVHVCLYCCFVCQVYNGSYDAPYVNPKAPVHFITGAAVSSLMHVCL